MWEEENYEEMNIKKIKKSYMSMHAAACTYE